MVPHHFTSPAHRRGASPNAMFIRRLGDAGFGTNKHTRSKALADSIICDSMSYPVVDFQQEQGVKLTTRIPTHFNDGRPVVIAIGRMLDQEAMYFEVQYFDGVEIIDTR